MCWRAPWRPTLDGCLPHRAGRHAADCLQLRRACLRHTPVFPLRRHHHSGQRSAFRPRADGAEGVRRAALPGRRAGHAAHAPVHAGRGRHAQSADVQGHMLCRSRPADRARRAGGGAPRAAMRASSGTCWIIFRRTIPSRCAFSARRSISATAAAAFRICSTGGWAARFRSMWPLCAAARRAAAARDGPSRVGRCAGGGLRKPSAPFIAPSANSTI